MRMPNKPGQKLDKPLGNNKEGLLNAFAKEIVHGNVVLLLGHESLLRIPSEDEISANKDLKLLKDCDGSIEKFHEILKTNFYEPFDEITLRNFYANLFDDDDENPLEVTDLNPEILKLIESKAFRIILTTTFNPLIEKAMENAWGGPGSIDIKNFCDKEKRDLSNIDKVVLQDDLKPTIYYLFGKATNNVSDFGNPKYIVDDEDYIQIIRDWMVNPPKNLMSYISNKRILAIGCKFENWLFRFFWRAVLETKKNSDDFKHLLAISLTSSPSDLKLREIFKLYNLKCPEDVNEFLNGLNKAIVLKQKKALIEERRKGGIFLSYCSQDFDKVLNLFYKLRDIGFNVWMDYKELSPGDEYKSNIKLAIANASIFVPIISRSVSCHLPAKDPYDETDENFHFYRDFEWNTAVLRYQNGRISSDSITNPLSIVPFALDDYNPRQKGIPAQIIESYPQIFEKTIESYNNAGFVRFIQTLKKLIP